MHSHTSFLISGFNGAIFFTHTHLLNQAVLQETIYPDACRVAVFQRKAANHIIYSKLLRQTTEGLNGLLLTLHVGSRIAHFVVKIRTNTLTR